MVWMEMTVRRLLTVSINSLWWVSKMSANQFRSGQRYKGAPRWPPQEDCGLQCSPERSEASFSHLSSKGTFAYFVDLFSRSEHGNATQVEQWRVSETTTDQTQGA